VLKSHAHKRQEPLGTAGRVALDRDKLVVVSGEPLFVVNCDIICEHIFAEPIRFLKSHDAKASIMAWSQR
jgi:NDP-sugar pyrophosphorylase family protein